MNILAIESSCDETACAVVKDGTEILSSTVATSSDMHEKWGGIVPEVAARKQMEFIIPVLTEALAAFQSTITPTLPENQKIVTRLTSQQSNNQTIKQSQMIQAPTNGNQEHLLAYKRSIEQHIDAIAVTVGPGLIGSLLIGIETAKTIAMICSKPVIPVNHVLAHMYANFISFRDDEIPNPKSQIPKAIVDNSSIQQSNNQTIKFPAISLVVSGGHTELYLMTSPKDLTWLGGTLDDAAGEAFDKTARLLGYGAGGGLAIQKAASQFSADSSQITVKLPRPMIYDNSLNFSFSGLKTAVMREITSCLRSCQLSTVNSELSAAFAHEIQESITDVLVGKTIRAAKMHGAQSILLSGGVAANLRLREKFLYHLSTMNYRLCVPPVSLCTDNAVYIASYAYFRGQPADWHTLDAHPDLSVEI